MNGGRAGLNIFMIFYFFLMQTSYVVSIVTMHGAFDGSHRRHRKRKRVHVLIAKKRHWMGGKVVDLLLYLHVVS